MSRIYFNLYCKKVKNKNPGDRAHDKITEDFLRVQYDHILKERTQTRVNTRSYHTRSNIHWSAGTAGPPPQY